MTIAYGLADEILGLMDALANAGTMADGLHSPAASDVLVDDEEPPAGDAEPPAGASEA